MMRCPACDIEHMNQLECLLVGAVLGRSGGVAKVITMLCEKHRPLFREALKRVDEALEMKREN